MPSRHRFLKPIHNVKEGPNAPLTALESADLVLFISGYMASVTANAVVEPIGIEPMT